MGDSPFLAFIYNASLLLAMAVVFDILAMKSRSFAQPAPRQVFLGLIVGAIGMALMMGQWQFEEGVLFDTRSVLLGIAGLFGGLIPAAIAMAITAAFRLYQGGVGTWPGVALIAASGCIGLAWRYFRRRDPEDASFGELLALGFVLHVTMLALMFALPWEIAVPLVTTIGIPLFLVHPLATALLGSLLANQLRRNRMGGRLAESEERLRLALSAANQGMWDLDTRTGEASVSAEYAAMLGFDPATFRETNDAWIARLHPDDREATAAAYRDCVSGKLPEYRVEFRQRTAKGGYLWLLSKGSIVERDSSGAPVRMMGTHTDITELRQTQERLRAAQAEATQLLANSDLSRLTLLGVVEDLQAADAKIRSSEKFYRSLFENMNEGFAYCRIVRENGQPRDFVFLRVNAAFERMRDLSNAEGHASREMVPDVHENNPELLAAYDRVATTGAAEMLETYVKRLDRWFRISVFSPEKDHFITATTDITESKRVALEIERQLAELRKWHEVTLGREDRVLQLKAEVNELRQKLGEPPRYASAKPGGQ